MLKKVILIGFFAVSVVFPVRAVPFGEKVGRVVATVGAVGWFGGVVKACLDGKSSTKLSTGAFLCAGAFMGVGATFDYKLRSSRILPAKSVVQVVTGASFISLVPSAGIAAIQFVRSIGMKDEKSQSARKRSQFSGVVAGVSALGVIASCYGSTFYGGPGYF